MLLYLVTVPILAGAKLLGVATWLCRSLLPTVDAIAVANGILVTTASEVLSTVANADTTHGEPSWRGRNMAL